MFTQTTNCVNVSSQTIKTCQYPQDQQKDKNDHQIFSIRQQCPYKFKKKIT
jgi:hypothetical protein